MFCSHEEIWSKKQDSIKIKKCMFIDEIKIPVADLGENNRQKQLIENYHNIQVKSIDNIDFNDDLIPGRWNTIFCFELLEHILNPLFFMQNIIKSLNPGGVCYLSTPSRLRFFWPDYHWNEIDKYRLGLLFGWQGVELCVEKQMNIRLFNGWKWHLKGVRPFLRLNTFTTIYKLKKRNKTK